MQDRGKKIHTLLLLTTTGGCTPQLLPPRPEPKRETDGGAIAVSRRLCPRSRPRCRPSRRSASERIFGGPGGAVRRPRARRRGFRAGGSPFRRRRTTDSVGTVLPRSRAPRLTHSRTRTPRSFERETPPTGSARTRFYLAGERSFRLPQPEKLTCTSRCSRRVPTVLSKSSSRARSRIRANGRRSSERLRADNRSPFDYPLAGPSRSAFADESDSPLSCYFIAMRFIETPDDG